MSKRNTKPVDTKLIPSPDPSVPITKVGDGKWFTKVQLDWIPVPAEALEQLGWDEGTELEAFIMYNDQIVIRRKGALSAGSTD